MKFKLNDRVVWKDDKRYKQQIEEMGYTLKGTIIELITINDLITDGLTHFITIKWDNAITINYTDSNINLSVEIDKSYQRDKILNELGL